MRVRKGKAKWEEKTGRESYLVLPDLLTVMSLGVRKRRGCPAVQTLARGSAPVAETSCLGLWRVSTKAATKFTTKDSTKVTIKVTTKV